MYLGLIFFIRYLFFESFTWVFDLQWFKGKDKINNVTRYLGLFLKKLYDRSNDTFKTKLLSNNFIWSLSFLTFGT